MFEGEALGVDQVGFSDIELVWLYWKLFESEKFPGDYITKEHMFAFEQNAVIGERACKDSKSV